jgi:hypothetical protein
MGDHPDEQVPGGRVALAPTVVGTGFFLTGAILSKLVTFDNPEVDVFREPTVRDHITAFVGSGLFLACYAGATLGPLLLPVAAQQAFGLTRAAGVRSSAAIRAWTVVGWGVALTAVFWGWLIQLDLFV